MGWLERLETKGDDGFVRFGAHPVGTLSGHRGRSALESNVIMSPLSWIMRNFTEADPIVEVRRQGIWQHYQDHELELRLNRPNPFYTGGLLWRSTVLSLALDGNAYWQKVRNVYGEVVGYWYLPHFAVEPRYPLDGSEFISHYEYAPVTGGPALDLPVRDVVHYRARGLDPNNPRKGMSALKTLLREVFTDEEAANFSATILSNMGVPGGVIAPKDASSKMSPAAVQEMKEYMKGSFTGKHRGEWLVVGAPTEISQFGFNPQMLMLTDLRDISEDRVCAALGVPAAVVGFGSGLQQTKVGATMREMRKEAWDSCIRPMQNDCADQADMQCLPDFVSQVNRFRIRFDTSNFAASQEEEKERAERVGIMVEKGILRVDKAQQILGLEVDESQNVYLRPSNTVAVREGDDGIPEDTATPAPTPAPAAEGAPKTNGGDPSPPLTRNRIREILETAAFEGEATDE